jgi:hypothetical protein
VRKLSIVIISIITRKPKKGAAQKNLFKKALIHVPQMNGKDGRDFEDG